VRAVIESQRIGLTACRNWHSLGYPRQPIMDINIVVLIHTQSLSVFLVKILYIELSKTILLDKE
jgi:hypothetical protein